MLRSRIFCSLALLLAAPACLASPELQLSDMTFVGSRDGLREVLVESRTARFLPEPGKA